MGAFAETGRTYVDGEKVPFPSYRCKGVAKTRNEKHECRRHVDHDGEHKCICQKTWARKAGA